MSRTVRVAAILTGGTLLSLALLPEVAHAGFFNKSSSSHTGSQGNASSSQRAVPTIKFSKSDPRIQNLTSFRSHLKSNSVGYFTEDLEPLIQEAWRRAQLAEPATSYSKDSMRAVYRVDMGQPIGYRKNDETDKLEPTSQVVFFANPGPLRTSNGRSYGFTLGHPAEPPEYQDEWYSQYRDRRPNLSPPSHEDLPQSDDAPPPYELPHTD